MSSGVFQSPGYPDKYPMNDGCGWQIIVNEGQRVNLTFTDFNVPPYQRYFQDWRDCDSYLLIYDARYPDDQFRITSV